MRVAVSGVTSYTGMCIAEAFAQAGCDATGLCRSAPQDYSGLSRLRLSRTARSGVRVVGGLDARGSQLSAWLLGQQLDVWVHHHHPMDRFRSADYDVLAAREAAVQPLPGLVRALCKSGARAIIFSSTYFEPGEGGQSLQTEVTPYAAVKAQTCRALERECEEQGLAFARVVIPAPTGALENVDRLTPLMLTAAQERQEFELRSADSVMDLIPGEVLAQGYVRAAEVALSSSPGSQQVYRPSAKVISARDWAAEVRSTIATRLGLTLKVRLPAVASLLPKVHFANREEEQMPVDWEEFAARYAREWREGYPFR